MKIEYLPWDSSFFNKKVGKLVTNIDRLNPQFMKNIESALVDYEYDLIYFFTKLIDIPRIPNLNLDIIYTDTHVRLGRAVKGIIGKKTYFLIDKKADFIESLGDLYKISDQVSKYSRFNKDPKISKEKIRIMYKKMVDNCLNGNYGDGILLELDKNGKVLGILSFSKTSNDTISELLIGVDKDFKGKGIGKKLINSFLNYAKDVDANSISTTVSASNLDSFNFHIKNRYTVKNIYNIYHVRLAKLRNKEYVR